MAAFQPYAGVLHAQDEVYRWSCYATCRVYEVRALDTRLPEPPRGRRWAARRQHGQAGPCLAILIDEGTADFSHMLAQISRPKACVALTAA